MVKKYLDIEEVKEKELDILLAFKQFAEKNNICFSLAYGTLLGAIRHKGFIPWDDDIDVVVPRPDYDRIVSLAKEGILLGPYKFTGYEIDKFPMPFVKMVDTRISVEDHATKKSIPLNLWIDIFPLDSVPSDPDAFIGLYKKVYFLRSLIKVGNYKFWGAGKTRAKRFAKMIAMLPVKLFRLNDHAERKLLALAQSTGDYNSATHVAAIVWGAYWAGEQLEKSIFEELIVIEFQGRFFPAPAKWDSYLTSLYGDYMTLPPEEEQYNHGVKAWYN